MSVSAVACLHFPFAFRLSHPRPGHESLPRTAAAGRQSGRKKHFRGKGGGSRREGRSFFKRDPFLPRDDSPPATGPQWQAGRQTLVVQFQIGGGLRALFADADAVDAHMAGAFIGGQTAGHVLEDMAGDVLRRRIEAVEGRDLVDDLMVEDGQLFLEGALEDLEK